MNLKLSNGWYWEVLCLLVYLVLAGDQLFVSPIIGMADNGDFPKVLGRSGVCDPDHQRDVLEYVYPKYLVDPACYWNSQLPSSESIFVDVNKWAAQLGRRDTFKITGAGKAHLSVMLAALMVLLWSLHEASPLLRFALPPLVILIFSDVLYVSYLNSFYMDAASMVFLLLAVALAAAWVLRPRTWVAIAFGIAGVLLGLAKTQHVVTAFFLAALAAWYAARAFRHGARRHAWYWSANLAAVALAAAATIAMTPKGYKAEPLYSLIFFRLNPQPSGRLETLQELGLPESDLPYFGTHAYSDNAAIASLPWRIKFNNRISYLTLAGYYLHNPSVALHLVRRGLAEDAPAMRIGFGNYLPDAGFPPHTQTNRFDWWSNLRAWLLWIFPPSAVIFYCVMGGGSLLCFFRQSWALRWPQYALVTMLAACGTVEFLFAVLLDGTEMGRHLFLFHVITECLIVCAAAAVLCILRDMLWPLAAGKPAH